MLVEPFFIGCAAREKVVVADQVFWQIGLLGDLVGLIEGIKLEPCTTELAGFLVVVISQVGWHWVGAGILRVHLSSGICPADRV